MFHFPIKVDIFRALFYGSHNIQTKFSKSKAGIFIFYPGQIITDEGLDR